MSAQLVCSMIAVVVYQRPSTALPVAIATGVVALVGVVLVLRMPHPAKHIQPRLEPHDVSSFIELLGRIGGPTRTSRSWARATSA